MGLATATITMTMREVDRIKTMQALVDRMLRPAQAAARLGLTVRQVERLARRYREEGAEGLLSQAWSAQQPPAGRWRGRSGHRDRA
jgi:transposase